MSEHDEVGTRLAAALHAEADRTTPEPGLQRILARARQAPARSVARRWWPALAGAVAAGALVAVALVVFSGSPTSGPPVIGSGQREVTVYFINADGKLVSEHVPVVATSDPGVDAVNALLTAEPSDPDYGSGWAGLGEVPGVSATVTVRSVAEDAGVITVDFSGPVDNPYNGHPLILWPDVLAQQLVATVQHALGSDVPVNVTRDGQLVDEVLSTNVRQPIERDPYALAPVQIESPTQGETVASPVTVSGQSATFEGNVVWRVKQDGKVVDHGFVQSQGANGVFGPFEFTVDLPPGDYTVEAYEESAENGDVINLDSKDFTVE